MKVLVTGARGMLARAVLQELESTCELTGRDVHDLDICDAGLVSREIAALRPDCIINCAAFTDVDGCESRSGEAFAVNADGVRNLAAAAAASGSMLYHISTDFVFDGTSLAPYAEQDEPNPLSVYGRSKLQGELHVQSILDRYVIVRTSWLFGRGGKNFVETIRRLARERQELRVVNDQTGCPTHAADLARAIRALMEAPAQGLYHVCNAGSCTWYDFAVKIVALTGGTARVVPTTAAELDRPAARPACSVMDCSRLARETGFRPKPWEDALREYLGE